MTNVAYAEAGAPDPARQPMNERLIVALDVPTIGEAREIVDQLGDLVSYFKIGGHLRFVDGVDHLIKEIIEQRNRLMVDWKVFDIDATMQACVAAAAERGIHSLTILDNGSLRQAQAEAAVAGKSDDGLPKLFCVTLLTSLDESDAKDLFNLSVDDVVLDRATKAHSWGCDGVIASGQEARLIKDKLGDDFLVLTPGIRPAGVSHDDQKRTATPGDAIRDGADYLIVGRPIIKRDDRREAAQEIIDEMEAAIT